jgi:hypothetical protein
MEQEVDPRFVRYFMTNVWKRAQEKDYFEKRRAYREWWWNNTVVRAWNCLTWTHAAILLGGSFSFASALFWLRMNWFLLSVLGQTTCFYGKAITDACFNNTTTDIHPAVVIMLCENMTAPFTARYFPHFLNVYYSVYSLLPFAETAIVGPFALMAHAYRVSTLPIVQFNPWFAALGFLCIE